jgi:hypothetical protein
MIEWWARLPLNLRTRSLLGVLECLEADTKSTRRLHDLPYDAGEYRILMERVQAAVTAWLDTGDWPPFPE